MEKNHIPGWSSLYQGRLTGALTLTLLVFASSSLRADQTKPASQTGSLHNPASSVQDAHIIPQGQLLILSSTNFAYSTDLFADGSEDTMLNTRLGLQAGLMDYLSLGFSISNLGNYHNLRLPATSQTVGDPRLSLRFAMPFGSGLSAAVAALAMFPTSADGIGLAWEATSPALLTSFTYSSPFHLEVNFNLGLRLMRNALAFSGTIDPVLRYAGQLSDAGLADVSLDLNYRIPIAKYFSLSPYFYNVLSAPVYQKDNVGGPSLGSGGGLRMGLGTNDALSVDIGAQIHFLRPDPNTVALPATPPWMIHAGLLYRFNPFVSPKGETPKPVIKTVFKEKEVIKEVTKEVAPPTGVVQGHVFDKSSKQPVVNAIVQLVGSDASPLSVGGTDGQFKTFPMLANKPFKLKVVAPGYKEFELNVMVAPDQVRAVKIDLLRSGEQQYGEVRGTIKNNKGKALAARIVAIGVKGGRTKTDPKTGSFTLKLPVGQHNVVVSAKKFRSQKKKIQLRPGDVVILNVDMARK